MNEHQDNLPKDLEPVLAIVSIQSDLGLSEWYEVIYHNGEDWKPFYGSGTFDTFGYVVKSWVYCKDVLPRM